MRSCLTCFNLSQEQSFKEFVSRPEHKPLLEQHQKDEVTAAVQLQEQAQQAALEQEVSIMVWLPQQELSDLEYDCILIGCKL